MGWNHPDDVPTSLTRRAYALRGVTLSQNQYAAVVADAYEDIASAVAKELAKRVLELRSHASGSRRNRAFDGGYLAGLIAAALEIESPREEKT